MESFLIQTNPTESYVKARQGSLYICESGGLAVDDFAVFVAVFVDETLVVLRHAAK